MMDQKEHIATLCALGTIGAAATGLAFGTDQTNLHFLRPGKRKRPGSAGPEWSLTTNSFVLPRRSVSQPITPILPSNHSAFSSQPTGSSRQASAPKLFALTRENGIQDAPSSRGSSTSRRSILRPKSAASKNTAEKRDSGSSSSWIKRLSSPSSHSSSSAPSVKFQEKEITALPQITQLRPATSTASIPNKLVKRSTSQRALSRDEARGQILRRPATSHQRSQTFREILSQPMADNVEDVQDEVGSVSNPANGLLIHQPRLWRPFFESRFPRKRRRSESVTEPSQIRVITWPLDNKPVMLLGSSLDYSIAFADIEDDDVQVTAAPSNVLLPKKQRPRRSLTSLTRGNSRRRNFTDPSVQLSRTAASGTFSSIHGLTTSSPVTNGSVFHTSLPPDTPYLASSPPISRHEQRSSLRLHDSVSASDPPTTSSDADGRVFSDDDSLDFRSDTAYDSINTRATAASHTGLKESKLETIFAARTSDEMETRSDMWLNLDQQNIDNLTTQQYSVYSNGGETPGIGISILENKQPSSTSTEHSTLATPPRSASFHNDDFSVTPVPYKFPNARIDSSPPLLPTTADAKEYDRVGEMLDDMKLDDEDVDWSAIEKSFLNDNVHLSGTAQVVTATGTGTMSPIARFQESNALDNIIGSTPPKMSIFDWSEQQQLTTSARPITVHGKQGVNSSWKVDRSRASGRKGPPNLHFRSQSVPVNREGPDEDLPTTSKYQTWRLGHTHVSEEWSDDFEFDDTDDHRVDSPTIDAEQHNFRDSVRSVKIPQSIIDRQPSVHLQFGQVQEFMALVEELKRLRSKGIELQLVNGLSKHLWEDAESIINLATINDEEDVVAASSPTSSDPFTDIASIPNNTSQHIHQTHLRRATTTGRRSVSNITNPPNHGRARGDSLAQARHFLQAMHETRVGSSPREIEIHQQKKLPFDTQDLKDLVVRSGVITRALKQELRRAEGVSVSPHKTTPRPHDDHPLNELFRVPEPDEASSPCPPLRKPGFPKSRSANSYLEGFASRQKSEPFNPPVTLAAII